MSDWGYLESNGPATWADSFPLAAGVRQSPIDIDATVVSSDSALDESPLAITYQPDKCLAASNTGYGWKVDVDGDGSELRGGPLTDTYRLEQFHCHWGTTSADGSEHTVNGQPYPAELHLVHWNSDKYASFKEAASFPDGLAVVGVFLQVGDDEHSELAKVVNLMPNLIFKNQKVSIDDQIDPTNFLPTSLSYWTYPGSLTTPPCLETVTWIVLKEPITVTEDQIDAFRRIKPVTEEEDFEGCECITCNFRPPLPLNERVVRESNI